MLAHVSLRCAWHEEPQAIRYRELTLASADSEEALILGLIADEAEQVCMSDSLHKIADKSIIVSGLLGQ
ncbi:MAG: hypothetical protein H0V72_11475 [Bradyrhizobium sp.]|nr:hypothetical protein [Bradyrhizobium sp.]